ncbi:hypothetical protein V1477_015185, partial [Vespula maculifrons]
MSKSSDVVRETRREYGTPREHESSCLCCALSIFSNVTSTAERVREQTITAALSDFRNKILWVFFPESLTRQPHYISIIGPTIRSQGEGSTFSILSFRPRSSFHTSKALKLGGLKIAIKTSGNFEDLQFRENTARDPTKS